MISSLIGTILSVFRIAFFLHLQQSIDKKKKKKKHRVLPGKGTPKYFTKITSYSIWLRRINIPASRWSVPERELVLRNRPHLLKKCLSFFFFFSPTVVQCHVLFRQIGSSVNSFIWRFAWVLASSTHRAEKEIEATIDTSIYQRPVQQEVVSKLSSVLWLSSNVQRSKVSGKVSFVQLSVSWF
jgi:hypothetical protein